MEREAGLQVSRGLISSPAVVVGWVRLPGQTIGFWGSMPPHRKSSLSHEYSVAHRRSVRLESGVICIWHGVHIW